MLLLVLGGTAFLGRAVAEAARDRGLSVTCAARGSASPPPGVAFVRIDRDDVGGLHPLTGRRWDAVVDVARQPGHVRRAVRDLAAGHWVFVSTANVYARFDRPGSDEDAELLPPLTGRAVLTVCERSPSCTAGGMVRLDIGPNGGPVRFEVNLDAVARSVVRIHPQVLRLGRRAPGSVP